MKNIIYFDAKDATPFDFKRYQNSLSLYADIPADAIKSALAELNKYENMHVSLLVETGVALIEQYGSTEAAKEYYEAHKQYSGEKFERLRRITGYLVGTLDRWNDGKQAEERERVKHSVCVKQSVNSCVDDLVRAARLQDQALAHNAAYAGKAE